jgi:hypothetical protein
MVDIASGALLAVSPWLFGFSDRALWPRLVVGVMEIGAGSMTRTVPEDAAGPTGGPTVRPAGDVGGQRPAPGAAGDRPGPPRAPTIGRTAVAISPSATATSAGRPAVAAGVLGFALGGFFDGILLHQVLQWHHFLSLVPGEALRDIRAQILADGLFHVAVYAVAALGLWPLWRAHGGLAAADGRRLFGAGWAWKAPSPRWPWRTATWSGRPTRSASCSWSNSGRTPAPRGGCTDTARCWSARPGRPPGASFGRRRDERCAWMRLGGGAFRVPGLLRR